MTLAPQVIEQGPRHRVIVLASGEQIIQHPKEVRFPIWSMSQSLSPEDYQTLVMSKLETFGDVEVIDYYLTAFVEDYKVIDGTVPVFVAQMAVLHWPTIPEGH